MFRLFACLIAILFHQATIAQQKPLYTLFTSPERNTYYNMGMDIQRMCPQFTIEVVKSEGALDNINQIINAPVFKTGHRLGFTQSDVLEAVISGEPKVQAMIKTVMPLHTVDMSILVNRYSNIETLDDLKGKRIAIGTSGSAGWFAASFIKNSMNLKWISFETLPQESILKVLTGELDAMVVVSSHPYDIYKILGPTMRARVKLLDLAELPVTKMYSASVIPAATYEWQDGAVNTRAVQTWMVASTAVPNDAITNLLTCISNHQQELMNAGSPRWRSIYGAKAKTHG